MIDLKIVNTFDGGDLEQSGNDLATVSGVENTPYLAMFGGADWVGNFLTDKPFNSRTETVLNEVTLNSDGRLKIVDAMNTDLSYLSDIPGTTWTADATIIAPNRVRLSVVINGAEFSYLWNPETERELPSPFVPPYIDIWISPIRSGVSSRYAVTSFEMTSGADVATFPAMKFVSAGDEVAILPTLNSIAIAAGMSGVFQIQGSNIVYLQYAGETWAVTTTPIVLQTSTEIRLKVSTPSGSPQTWTYTVGGIGSYVITDWGDGSAITTTHPATTFDVVVSHIYADGLESKSVVIYSNDTLVKVLRINNAATSYRMLRMVSRPPLSAELFLVNNQEPVSPVNMFLSECANLSTISVGANAISSFSPNLLQGHFPNIAAVSAQTNNLSSAQVDAIFNNLVTFSPECLTRVGSVNTIGQIPAAPPTAASAAARGLLTTAGWTLLTD